MVRFPVASDGLELSSLIVYSITQLNDMFI